MQQFILTLGLFFLLGTTVHSQQDTITLYSHNQDIQGGQNVCLPVYVDNFYRIEVLQFSVNWHPGKLYFTGIQNINPGTGMKIDDIGLTRSDEGIAAVVFVDPFSGGNILPDSSILFEMCFNVIGEPNLIAPFNISDYPREYEAYGDNRFLTVDGHKSRHKVTAPNVGRIYARTCVDQSFAGNQGQLRFTAYGTNPPLVYSVTKFGDPTFQESGQMNEGQVISFSGLAAGEYRILVADIFGNEIIKIARVESGKGWTVPLNITLPTCHDSNDGAIEIDRIIGGVEPYIVSWSDGTVLKTELENIPEGRYVVSIEDNNRCLLSKSVNLRNPEPQYSVRATAPTCPNIPDGEIFLEVTGIPRYVDSTYLFGTDTSALAADTSFLMSQLVEGVYTIYIQDANGCRHTYIYDLKADNKYQIDITSQEKTSCLNTNDGSIAFHTYLDGNLSDEVEISISPDLGSIEDSVAYFRITNLPARSYEITLSSPSGMCSGDTTFTIERADTLSFTTLELGDETCSDDSTGYIFIKGEGGTGNNYTYNWSNGGTGDSLTNLSGGFYTVTVQDGNGCTVSGDFFVSEGTEMYLKNEQYISPTCFGEENGSIQIVAGSREGVSSDTLIFEWEYPDVEIVNDTSFLDSLLAGLYTVTISDEKKCAKTFDIELTSPEQLSIKIDSLQLKDCNAQNKGYIAISAEGGTMPYRYKWNNGDTTNTLSGITGDSYSVTITDGNACTIDSTFIIEEVEDPDYEITTKNITCSDGSNGQIAISISNDSIISQTIIIQGDDTIEVSSIGDIFADSLYSGKYTIIIKTLLGCEFIDSVNLQAPNFEIEINTRNTSCIGIQDGAAIIEVIGDRVIDSIRLEPNIGSIYSFEKDIIISNIDTGKYTLTLIDTSGCIIFDQFRILASRVKASYTIQDIECYGDSTGSALISVEAKSKIDSFGITLDSSINIVVDESEVRLEKLYSGTYFYYIITENGCELNDSIIVEEPDSLTGEILTTPQTSSSNGTAVANISGGTPPYTYIWSTAGAGDVDSIGNLEHGEYLLVVIDSNGCRVEFPFNIENKTLLLEHHNQSEVIYPNPAFDFLILELQGELQLQMQIYDVMGRLVMSSDLNTFRLGKIKRENSVETRYKIPIIALEDGIYFMRVNNENFYTVFTFVKQR